MELDNDTFRAVFDAALDAMVLADDEGRYVAANESACRLLGRSREEILQMTVHDVAPPDVDVDAAYRQFLEAGTETGFYKLVDADGQIIHVEYRATANVVPGLHLSVMRDVTDRRRLEAELVQVRGRATSILEQVTDAIYELDRDWRFTYLNPAAEQSFGVASRDLLGEVIWERFPEAVGTEFEDRYKSVMGERRPVSFEAYLPAPFDTWYREHVYPSDDGIVVYSRDIGHERQREEILERARRLESLGGLAGGVAHDFNNIMTVIGANVAMLREELEEDRPELELMLQAAEGAIDRARHLTEQLLTFGRGRIGEELVGHVNEVAEAILPLVTPLLGKEFELKVELTQEPDAWIVFDAQLDQVLLNIVTNAREAMVGGGTLVIATDVRDVAPDGHETVPAGRYAALEVTDTGPGMDADDLDHAFEPFFTRKEGNGARGMGLASAYGIVTRFGGDLQIRSVIGEGTTVTVLLPLAEPSTDEGVVPQPKEVTRLRGDGPVTVLVVDDDDAVRSVVERVLEREGYLVLTAGSSDEARRLSSKLNTVDVVLCDVVMPDTRGPVLVSELQGRHPEAAILYMTGYAQRDVLGSVGPTTRTIRKPFTPDQLLHAVEVARHGRSSAEGQSDGSADGT